MSNNGIRLMTAMFVAFVLMAIFAGSTVRAEERNQEDPDKIKVVVKEIPPFVIKDEERFSGFSIDLWEKLAQEAEIPFEYMEIETIDDQLAKVGIALPLESTYRKEINKALLDVTASGAYNEMNDKWFGG